MFQASSYIIGNAAFHSDSLYTTLSPSIPLLVQLLSDPLPRTRSNAAGLPCFITCTPSIAEYLAQVSFCSNTGSIIDIVYWTFRKNSLQLIELSSINNVSLVKVSSCSNTGSIRDDPSRPVVVILFLYFRGLRKSSSSFTNTLFQFIGISCTREVKYKSVKAYSTTIICRYNRPVFIQGLLLSYACLFH